MGDIKVSVIMPVYNVEKYLAECLQSVIGQTLREIEIICVNDGSIDRSPAILEQYALADARVHIITKENTGYGNSMNIGLDQAKGQYVSIVETDDVVDSSMLKELYSLAVEKDLDVIKTDRRTFVDTDRERVYTELPVLKRNNQDLYGRICNCHEDMRVFNGYVLITTGLYKREFLDRYHIRFHESPGASYQDNGFWFQTTMHAERLYFLNRAYYNLRRDNPNSSIHSKEKVFCMCDEYDFIRGKIIDAHLDIERELLFEQFRCRYANYMATMKRIASQYLQAFYDRMRQDFSKALRSGDIDPALFNQIQWRYIHTVLTQPEMSREGGLSVSLGIRSHLEETKEILIYGAGIWGKRVLELLRQNGWDDKIKGFLVSGESESGMNVEGIEVYPLKEFDLRADMLVLVAVADKHIPEMIENLRNIGHYNYFTKNEFLL